jgi:hypothetical protein
MHRSHPAPMQKFQLGKTIKRAAASSVGVTLLFSAVSTDVGLASSIRTQSSTATRTAANKSLTSSAGYQFDLHLEMTTEGGQPSRTSFRGRASLAEIDATTSRIQIQSIDMTQTDNGGVVRSVELSEQFRTPLQESFEVSSSDTPTLSVGQTEPEEVTNIKRALAKQIALTPNEDQTLAS